MLVIVRIYGDFNDFGRFLGAKTNLIQIQTKPILFSPQIFWGLKRNLKKQSQNKANSKHVPFGKLRACPEQRRMGQALSLPNGPIFTATKMILSEAG